jgi:hypothetical protein
VTGGLDDSAGFAVVAEKMRGFARRALDIHPVQLQDWCKEARWSFFIPNTPWISLCLYNLPKFNRSLIMDVPPTHPYTISGGVITENQDYHPDQ